MSAEIKELSPKQVWGYFYELTQIPRPTGHVEAVSRHIVAFGKQLGLETLQDKVGNVLIRKPATPGMEDRKTVTLQAHLDMVPQKNSSVSHNFLTDPIDAWIDGDWVKARETTLGADNGIGASLAMAVLADNSLKHGPVEALFTVDEEEGMVGAFGLKPGFLKGDILLNCDSEKEGELFVGCAGGADMNISFQFKEDTYIPEGDVAVRLHLSGLKGGHSGVDIHLGRANANKLMFRFLKEAVCDYGARLSSIEGGNLRNAIAREAHAVVGLRPEDKETVRILLNHFAADVENELKHVDKNVRLVMESTDKPETYIDSATAEKVIYAMHACPHGVLGMSHDIEGLVETSTNLASIKMKENHTILVGTSQRSSIESYKEMAANQVASTFLLAGAEVSHGDGYPGWAPNPDSVILKVAQETYERLFHKQPEIMAIHAGLECGLFLEKYPTLDMISFGPTLRDVHSPNERIEIKTVGMWWSHLLELLKNIPVK